jgi:hypothetical protein
MSNWKAGQRARVVTRAVTENDRKSHRYFDHMSGLVGVIDAVYAENEIALRVDMDCLTPVTRDVLAESTRRLRARVGEEISEEQKKMLTSDELNFQPNFVILVHSDDLESA